MPMGLCTLTKSEYTGKPHKRLRICVCTGVCEHQAQGPREAMSHLCLSVLGSEERRFPRQPGPLRPGGPQRQGWLLGLGRTVGNTLNCLRPIGPRGHPKLHTDRLEGRNLSLWRLPSCDSGLWLGPLSASLSSPQAVTGTRSWPCPHDCAPLAGARAMWAHLYLQDCGAQGKRSWQTPGLQLA